MIKNKKISVLDKNIIIYNNNSLNYNIENKKIILDYYNNLIELKLIIIRENIFNFYMRVKNM